MLFFLQKMSPLFFISHSRSLLPFFSFASALQTRVAMQFPAKITLSCIWVTIRVNWVISPWYACGTDGRTYGHVITKLSWMGRLPHFLTYGAPLRGRELLYYLYLIIYSSIKMYFWSFLRAVIKFWSSRSKWRFTGNISQKLVLPP